MHNNYSKFTPKKSKSYQNNFTSRKKNYTFGLSFRYILKLFPVYKSKSQVFCQKKICCFKKKSNCYFTVKILKNIFTKT